MARSTGAAALPLRQPSTYAQRDGSLGGVPSLSELPSLNSAALDIVGQEGDLSVRAPRPASNRTAGAPIPHNLTGSTATLR